MEREPAGRRQDSLRDSGAALTALAARAAGVLPTDLRVGLRPPLDHQSNRLYDAWAPNRHLIIKEYLKEEEWADAPVREFRALELLRPLDIAPQPVRYAEATDEHGPIVIYEFLEGQAWDRRRPTRAQLGHLAEIWLAMNVLPTGGLWMSRNFGRPLADTESRLRDAFEDYATWAGADFPPAVRAADLCLAALDRCAASVKALSQARPTLCFCRSDQRFANVIGRPDGRLGLVDWEDSGLRDPARDVADLLTHPNQEDLLTPSEWRGFLDPYFAARTPLDSELPDRVWAYIPLFSLFWVVLILQRNLELARRGEPAERAVNGLHLEIRLRRNLARGLAGTELDFSGELVGLEEVRFFPSPP